MSIPSSISASFRRPASSRHSVKVHLPPKEAPFSRQLLCTMLQQAVSAAFAEPAITTWPGELKFTAATTSPVSALRLNKSQKCLSSSRPMMAYMAPSPAGTACCIKLPLASTSLIASLKGIHAGTYHCRVFAKTVAGQVSGLRFTLRFHHVPDRNTCGKQSRLSYLRLVELTVFIILNQSHRS